MKAADGELDRRREFLGAQGFDQITHHAGMSRARHGRRIGMTCNQHDRQRTGLS